MKLHVIIEQDEDGYFVAEIPALPGCLSQGKTSDEAIANIKEAGLRFEVAVAVASCNSRYGSFRDWQAKR